MSENGSVDDSPNIPLVGILRAEQREATGYPEEPKTYQRAEAMTPG